jgi:thiol-disulfide isomerase/thioredoxin
MNNAVQSYSRTAGNITGAVKSSAQNVFIAAKPLLSDPLFISLCVVGLAIALLVIRFYIYPMAKPYLRKLLKMDDPNPNNEFNTKGEGLQGQSGKEAEIMFFHTDWCPHCKTAKPEWEQVKAEYDGKTINGYTVYFTDVNCTTDSPETEKMMNTYKIEGYPTIKLLKDGTVIEYDAKPTRDTLVQFLNTVL